MIAEFALTTIIAGATIWIAITANRISKMQLEHDLARQKLDWCRACLQSVSQAVTLASYSQTEIESLEFEKTRRQLRGKIISLKNEGELFLTAKDQVPNDVASLRSLRRCYKAMDGDLFRPPTEENADGSGMTRDEILASLEDFRKAMRKDFGNKWSAIAEVD